MKRFLSLFLSLVLALGLLGAAPAEEASSANGFTLTDERRFELVGADIELYQHDKTGALVMFILNDDTNRAFEITFRTPCETSKGIAHVLEHSVLDGSAKYPSKSLFFNLSYQTYNTYMNASTYNFMTTYPVASLSEDQLLKYADFYTDSVFNPLIIEDESIFREEAWRYTLSDAEGELGVAGTVYSEMQGAYTINRAASLAFDQTLFPGSTSGRDSGGIPEVIYTMTWDDLKEFHGKYYHPSNSLTCIYGKIEQKDAFLALLDGFFSAYEAREYNITDFEYVPVDGPQEAAIEYGLAAGSDTANGAVIYYGFAVDCDKQTLEKLDYFTTLFSDDSSVFQQNLKEQLPSATGACYIDLTTPELCVYFYATGVNPEDAQTFKAIVDDSIADAAENGFDPDAVDAIVAGNKLSIMLASESSSTGVDLIPSIAYYWAAQDDLYGYMDYIDNLDNFELFAKDGTIQAAVKDYVAGNERSALLVAAPVAGLLDENNAAFAAMLAEVKAGMTEEEIAAIVDMTNASDEADDATELVRALTAVEVSSLPEEKRIYDIADETDENGIRFVTVDANTDGVGETALLLDASGLTQEQIHFFKLFVDMLGDLETERHTPQQLASLTNRYLYNGVIRVSAMGDAESCRPYVRCTFTALDEDIQPGYDLVYELLFETKLDDADEILKRVSNIKNSLKKTLISSSYSVMLYRAMSAVDATTAYFNYATYLDYYDFLCAAEEALAADPESVLAQLKAVQEYFFNRTGAIAGFVGNEESAQVNRAAATDFLMKLDEKPIEKAEYDFGTRPASEALIVDGNVNYNLLFAGWDALGLEGYDGAMDAVTAYVSDVYLYPLLRDQYGAYGVIHYASDSGVYVISYRDPNLTETFQVYASLPELIAQDDPDQETLNGYIQSAYSSYALSNGELADGFSALLSFIDGDAQEDAITAMQQLKSITPETFKGYAALYEKLIANGAVGTAGSAAAIGQNADMFENILNPFGVKDASEVGFADLTEDHPYYEATRACYENALVFPASEGEFGVDAPATFGDFATAIYIYLGGDNSPADAIAYLGQYGIVPDVAPETEMTREDLAYYSAVLCYAFQVPVEETPLDGVADADEVDAEAAGFIGWSVSMGLVELTEDGKLLPAQTATRGELCNAVYVILLT